MKKLVCFVIIACMLMVLPGCEFLKLKKEPANVEVKSDSAPVKSDSAPKEEVLQSQAPDLKPYIGEYCTSGSEIELTIFDIDPEEGVFFEIGLIEEWVISGVATLKDNTASFVLTGNNPADNQGTMIFEDGKITLEILCMQKNFEHNAGVYTMTPVGDVAKDTTYCDSRLNLSDHGIFTEFVNTNFAGKQTSWEYLGHTGGEVGIISYEPGINTSTDLYRLSVEDRIIYYGVYLANRMDEDEYGVCEFIDGKLSDFIFTKLKVY